MNNEEELIAILTRQATLLGVDEDELAAILHVLTFDPKSFMEGF